VSRADDDTDTAANADAGLAALAGFIQRHRDIVVLTGAGMSTASGIPDYRDREGVRRGRKPIEGPDFRRDEAVRRRYWARSMVGYPTLSRATPNAGHRAIAALQGAGRLGGLITQNVDGLHQRGGSVDVTELHGNIHHVVCLACATRFTRTAIQELLVEANPAMQDVDARALPDGDAELEPAHLAGFIVPPCPLCSGMLQPDVVFFGDGVPRAATLDAEAKVAAASALLVIGSSLMVFSGFRLCRLASEAGKPIAAVNLGRTRADDLLALKIEASAEQLLPLLAALPGAA
jgi:NAD-dependent SIR2 family protein deacetylase